MEKLTPGDAATLFDQHCIPFFGTNDKCACSALQGPGCRIGRVLWAMFATKVSDDGRRVSLWADVEEST